ncbi:phage major capsid protein [Vibrio owensii]|uniref:phage major capsid protein n=1 Tax=Vibrio owensii TaxID=696485 RepID=UPI002F41FF48
MRKIQTISKAMQKQTQEHIKNNTLIKTITSDQIDLLTHQDVVAAFIKRAITDTSFLSRLNVAVTDTPKFRQPILTKYLTVMDSRERGADGLPIISVDESEFSVHQASFKKIESLVTITHEIIKDSNVDLHESILGQISEQMAVMMQDFAFNDSEYFGMCDYLIDRPNAFLESLKADADRRSDFYKVTKSGVNASFGADAESVTDFIMSLVRDVPSKYQNTTEIFMNRTAWFDGVLDVFGSATAKDVLIQDNTKLSFMGYKVNLVDSIPDDCIIVGDVNKAFEMVSFPNSVVFNENEIVHKGRSELYHSMRYSFLPLDNTAVRIGVQGV